MAYITGLTPLGCSLPGKYLGDGIYECEPDVDEFHKRHKTFNDYHFWYAKIVGKKGEKVTIRLKWPEFKPEEVSEEYKTFIAYSPDWVPFFRSLKDSLYLSTDELKWEHIEGAYDEESTVVFSVVLPADECFVTSTLRYSMKSFDDLIKTVTASSYISMLNLGKGWDGGDILTFVATDNSVPKADKKTVYIHAMQHSHESPGAYVCDFLLRYLAKGKDGADELLRRFIFRITPVVDAAGWRTGREFHPEKLNNILSNHNRDWGVFEYPETKALANYLEELAEQGENFALCADLHGGSGDWDENEEGSNSIFLEMSGTADEVAQRRRFIDMVRYGCDYMKPDDYEYWEFIGDKTMFASYAEQFAPSFTFEISMAKMWDRKAGKRVPNSQAGYERFAKQLLRVISDFCSK